MARRTPLLLVLLAVGALCALFWDDVIAPMFAGEAEEFAGFEDDGDYYEDEEPEEDDEFSPGLASAGRARTPEELARRAAAIARAGGEGPGGHGASAGSIPFIGKVVDSAGKTVAAVKVQLMGDRGTFFVETDEDGAFKTNVPAGRYAVRIDGGERGGLILRAYMLDGEKKEDLQFALREPGAVQIKVTRGSEGVSGAEVLLTSRDLGEAAQHSGLTGSDGIATLEGVIPGRWLVNAKVPDGPTVEHNLYAGPGKTSPVNVRIPGGVVLKGTVRAGKDGPGVGGAMITLHTQVPRSHGIFQTVFETGADGSYEVNVPRGNPRKFAIEAEGHAVWPAPRESNKVLRSLRGLRGSKAVTRNATLLSGAVLQGIVRTEDEKPIPNVALRFVMRRGPTIDITSGPDGRYLAANLIPGAYELQVETPAWFPITGQRLRVGIPGGAEPKATDFDVVLVAARRLYGTVVDAAGQGVGGARVWIVGGGRVVRSARQAGRDLEVFTGSNGSWSITDIPPDKNVVVRAAMGKLEADPQSAPWERPPPMPLRMQLKGTGDIAGRVTDIDTRNLVGGVRVRIVPDPWNGRTSRTVYTNRQGEFRVERMLPGKWKFTPYKRGFLRKQETQTATVVRGSEIDVDVGIDPGTVFAGVVVDEAGKPVRGARVNVRGRSEGATRDTSRSVTVNGAGKWSLTGFERGVWRITAWRKGYVTVRENDQRISRRGMHIVLRKR